MSECTREEKGQLRVGLPLPSGEAVFLPRLPPHSRPLWSPRGRRLSQPASRGGPRLAPPSHRALGAPPPQALAQPSRYPPPQGVASHLSGGWEVFLTLFYFGKCHCDKSQFLCSHLLPGSQTREPLPVMVRSPPALGGPGLQWEWMAAGGARRFPVHQGCLSLSLSFS